MVTVEFQAKVKDGVIVIPEEYKQELATVSIVKVTVEKQPRRQHSRPDIFDELAENPVEVDGFLTRDEIHDRTL